MNNIAITTTFPNNMWDVYAKRMLQSFVQYWPVEAQLLVALDDELIFQDVNKILRPQDGISVGWDADHKAFVESNKGKDDPNNYRFQAVRFCHKVFAIKKALDAINAAKTAYEKDPEKAEKPPRYLIWMDADVITNRPISIEEIEKCLPKNGDSVAYLGRKDWDHSECGWLAFDLDNYGDEVIDSVVQEYIDDYIFKREQWHDSWIWDATKKARDLEAKDGRGDLIPGWTNLSPEAKGLDAWSFSPMAAWSIHYKGPTGKQQLLNKPAEQIINNSRTSNVVIKTKNAIPDKEIQAHIRENQELITKWVQPCVNTDDEIVFVSAGPMLVPEDIRNEQMAGRKIIAVKHALKPLKEAGVKVWATILLDPRPHVYDFVQNPDKDIIWFVASQVNPKTTKYLLDNGCIVWGYHASVNAGEGDLISKQSYAIISGGSATATRGMYVMAHMGFHRFRLYGYDLCLFDKPEMGAKDEFGQPKYMEISISFNDILAQNKRQFYTEPQFIAQFEEIQEMVKADKWEIKAFGEGIVPFIVRSKELANLRSRERIDKIIGKKRRSYHKLLGLKQWQKPLLTSFRKRLPNSLRKLSLAKLSLNN